MDNLTLIDRLSDCLPKVGEPEARFSVVETADLRMILDGLAQYLKEDETPAQRIERERKDTGVALKLLAKEKFKSERLSAQLAIAARGLKHCAGWNINEDKRNALMAVVIESEALIEGTK